MPNVQGVQRRFLHGQRVAHAQFTSSACGREVTVGDALAVMLPTLRKTIRDRIGPDAVSIGAACDEFVNGVCRCWPTEYMSTLARRAETDAQRIMAVPVLTAKVREDVEAMWGMHANVVAAYDKIGMRVVLEFAALWFESTDNRTVIRQCCREARRTA